MSIIEHFAHYVWWEKPHEIIESNPLRVVASAMRYANTIQEYAILIKLDKNILRKTLKEAQAGWIDSKSWHYWHIILYGKNAIIPTLPKRKFMKD